MSEDAYRQRRWYSRPLLYASVFVLTATTMYATLQGGRYFSAPETTEETAQDADWLNRRVRGAKIRIDRAKKAIGSFLGNDEVTKADPAQQSLDTRITILDSQK